MGNFVYGEQLTDEGRFYALAIRSRRSEDDLLWLGQRYHQLGAARLLKATGRLKITAAVVATLVEEVGVIDPQLTEVYNQNRQRVLALRDALSDLGRLSERYGFVWALIESGGVLFSSDLPWAALGSGDIDILVAPGDEPALNEALRVLGFSASDRGEDRIRTQRVSHSKVGPGGTSLWLETCSVAFERAWTPLGFQVDERLWLARRVPSPRARDVSVLCVEDLLVQVALHTSTHFYVLSPGARLCIDVDRMVSSHDDLDWRRTVQGILAAGAPTRGLLSLLIARDLCDTAIPEEVVEQLTASETRVKVALALLKSRGCLTQPLRPLGRTRRLCLGALLHDDGLAAWGRSTVAPSRSWLEGQFSAPEEDVSLALLHWRRLSGWLGRRAG